MKTNNRFLLAAILALALAFIFGCSSPGGSGFVSNPSSSSGGNETSFAYCITALGCLPGPFTASTCTGQLSNSCPTNPNPTYSLDGVWKSSTESIKGRIITISGSIGVFSAFGTINALTQSAIDKGYWKLGDQAWRNITSTGNLTWSGQFLATQYNTSNPNVAIGTGWVNATFTLSADGQTLTCTSVDGSATSIWTRSTYSLDGVWESSTESIKGRIITISGSIGVFNAFGTTSALTQSAIDKGYWKLGDQAWRNITSTGNLTWSGQFLGTSYNTSNPNVAIGTGWVNATFTLSADGQTLTCTSVDGFATSIWTRKQ